MKKILPGIFAIAVAFAASAFTAPSKEQAPTNATTTTLYYFFEVVSGQVDPNSPLNDEPMTLEEFEQINPVNCPSGNNADCIRAWEPGHNPTATGASDYAIRKQ